MNDWENDSNKETVNDKRIRYPIVPGCGKRWEMKRSSWYRIWLKGKFKGIYIYMDINIEEGKCCQVWVNKERNWAHEKEEYVIWRARLWSIPHLTNEVLNDRETNRIWIARKKTMIIGKKINTWYVLEKINVAVQEETKWRLMRLERFTKIKEREIEIS